MKNAHLILFFVTVFLLSCSDSKDGIWEDNIELSQKEVQFGASQDSVIVTTKKDGWWIVEVSLNGATDFEQMENSNGEFLMDENKFTIERRSPKKLYIEMSPNSTNSERKLIISLQNGNYFDGITIKQAAK
ncbi:MAG: hypothetical protein R3353_02045 [Salegentibacter mishustinae]|nr:hypothetical protein [Salegentibacter mishustinae]